MAYRALYREWRPKDFSHVVGQNAIIDTLRNQVIAKRIAHAYLFCGSRGTGKTSTAKILANAGYSQISSPVRKLQSIYYR